MKQSTKPTKGAKKNAAKKRKRASVARTNPYLERNKFNPRVREPRVRDLDSNERLPRDDESDADARRQMLFAISNKEGKAHIGEILAWTRRRNVVESAFQPAKDLIQKMHNVTS